MMTDLPMNHSSGSEQMKQMRRTWDELYEAAKAELPTDFTHNKVQNVLLREMRPELVVTEAKGRANTYRLK